MSLDILSSDKFSSQLILFSERLNGCTAERKYCSLLLENFRFIFKSVPFVHSFVPACNVNFINKFDLKFEKISPPSSVTILGDLLHFGQLFKAFGSN